MKKLGIVMAFAFMGLTSFATANAANAANAANDGCIDVTLSCGETYEICDSTLSTPDMIKGIIAQDGITCG